MSDELLIRHCSPTLAGLKTGSLFPTSFSEEEDPEKVIGKLNARFFEKKLRFAAVCRKNGIVLIYVYRPSKLRRDLQNETAKQILISRGYTPDKPAQCVSRLIGCLRNSRDFPHEIGLFLGYPAEDVKGFICHNAGKCKCCGYWKVYGNVEQAEKTFAKFTKCKRVYYEQWSSCKSIERLTVAV